MGGPGENYAGPPFDGCHRTSLAESRANVDDWPGELHRKLGLAATAGPGSAPIERSALQEAQLRMAWSAGSRARRRWRPDWLQEPGLWHDSRGNQAVPVRRIGGGDTSHI